jgi:hypothetical protein
MKLSVEELRLVRKSLFALETSAMNQENDELENAAYELSEKIRRELKHKLTKP